jgi:glucose/arabinose dehydrogenase/uncharacterized protein YecT (DUF1311 family)
MTRLTWILLLAACHAGAAHAASFDCRKAGTKVETLVCADPGLSKLDDRLAEAYESALARATAPTVVENSQVAWLRTQRNACGDADCLRREYTARIAALQAMHASAPSAAAESRAREMYAAPSGTCDGYPRLAIGMADGFCAGLIAGPTRADPARTIALPRSLVQLDARTWLVSDLGGWGKATGAVWRLHVEPGQTTRVEPVLTGLKLPHALARGPDGKVYVGEMSRIVRFDPQAADPASTLETVIADLPDNRLHDNRHPLSKFVFDADGAVLVNVGAPSDQCLDKQGQARGSTCPESDAGEQAASLRRYALLAPGRWSTDYTVHARGLRNSVALARHPSGTILQGENSYDFDSRFTPFDELNRIEAGHHYGWPYCADAVTPTPGWKAAHALDCASAQHTPPVLFLPPHAAPLDLLWYDGAMFPALRGHLLVTWHGFRASGGRLAAFATDADGIPVRTRRARFPLYGGAPRAYGSARAADAFVLTPGWNKSPGVRPQGSPVGLAVADDGAIWVTDDRAGVVIRIAQDRP